MEFIQLERTKDDSDTILHYTTVQTIHPTKDKTKRSKPMWHIVLHQCGDLLVLENFIGFKQKKKGLIVMYNSDYPSDFIIKKFGDRTATMMGCAVSRLNHSGMMAPHKMNKKMFQKYFKDEATVLN